ncbi:GGDEF domain-containing protein [Candidatus Micrarchaeota archaeon]|nr:GGDEF domain-containing protein [Candidatus Micrarchaeota archaeon]
MNGGKKLCKEPCPDAGGCHHLREQKDKVLTLTRQLHELRNSLMVEEARRTTAEEQLLTDPLTGAFNRRGLEKKFPDECSKTERFRSKKLFMLFFDIDNFGLFNKEYGETTGDMVLKDVVKTVEASLRPYDSVFRIGGEEFVILLPELKSFRTACRTAERIRKKVAGLAITPHTGGEAVHVTISVGVARLGSGDSLDTLIDKANEAEQEAKKKGKNRTYIYLGGEVLAAGNLVR